MPKRLCYENRQRISETKQCAKQTAIAPFFSQKAASDFKLDCRNLTQVVNLCAQALPGTALSTKKKRYGEKLDWLCKNLKWH